ncbi:MAG: TrmH family RNA methyltransferase [Balneolaceae bacterium]|nr:MAG: TrmH family RNA methyltransferase [Balneolaceae bacterium]
MKKLTTKEILQQNLKRSSPLKDSFILWLHDIRSLHNVGAVFRCADAFGIRELWLSGFTPVPPRSEITKTAIGAEEYVTWKKIDDEIAAISELKKNGYLVLGLEQTDSSILIRDLETTGNPVCLILGNEVTGIDSKLLDHLDATVEIPQFGMKHSLNVSVAAGVALYAFLMKESG